MQQPAGVQVPVYVAVWEGIVACNWQFVYIRNYIYRKFCSILGKNRGSNLHLNTLRREIEERTRLEETRTRVEQLVRHDLKNPLTGIIGLSN